MESIGLDRTDGLRYSSKEIQHTDVAEPSEDCYSNSTHHDQLDMKRLGKEQELTRNFRLVSSIAFTTCVMGTWEILLTANTQGLIAGGLAGLFWSLCWSFTGQFFVVLSLAEMASMAPTAGGQYHWVSEFAPRRYQRYLSYASGWLSALSWQSIVALDSYIVGLLIQGIITLNEPSYTPQRWQGTLFVFASIIGMSAFNIFAAKQLALAESVFVAFHVLAFFPIIITLLALAPKQTAAAVFTQFTDNGAGWPTTGVAVLVGQVSAMFAVLGSDSVAHMSEEVEDAGVVVPKAMVWSFLLNVPFTFGLLLTYLFCIGNVEEAISSPAGFPFIYVFYNATGTTGGTTAMVVVVLLLVILITISVIAGTSRQTFAFARDNGLPFSKWIARVDPTRQVPVNSIIVTCLFTMVLSLINIGSSVAFNAVLSLSCTALMATYCISIGCVALKRLRKEPLPPARWALGKYGIAVNGIALLYACWSFFWSFWPNSHDIAAVTFNWACVLFVGIMGIASVIYLVYARKVFEGPVVKVEGRAYE